MNQPTPRLTQNNVLVAQGIDLSFNQATRQAAAPILKDVHLEIASGEIVALLGRSGAGKTSLLNVLAGFVQPQAGQVRFSRCNNQPKIPPFAFVFQEDRLLPWKTTVANVELALERIGVHRRERRRQALEALADVGLESAAKLYPWQLSGGMKSRAALVRALALQAPLLFMDEPFSKLDVGTRSEMHALMRRLRKQHQFGALLVTHDVDEAVELADRALVLQPHIPGLREVAWDRRNVAQVSESLRQMVAQDTNEDRARDAKAVPAHRPPNPQEISVDRRRVLAGIGAAAIASPGLLFSRRAWAKSVSASSNNKPLRIGYWASGVQLVLFEAIKQLKLFEKHGLNFEFMPIADVNGLQLGLAKGDVDIALSIPVVAALSLAEQKRKLKILLITQGDDASLVTGNPKIQTVADIRNTIVGVHPVGTATYAYSSYFLEKNDGLGRDDYRIAGGSESRLVQLLVKGEISSATLRHVTIVHYKDKLDLRVLMNQRKEWEKIAGKGKIAPTGVVAVRDEILDNRREQAVSFVAAVLDAIKIGNSDPDRVARALKQNSLFKAGDIDAAMGAWSASYYGKLGQSDVESIDKAQEVFINGKFLKRRVSSAYYGRSVYEDALKQVA